MKTSPPLLSVMNPSPSSKTVMRKNLVLPNLFLTLSPTKPSLTTTKHALHLGKVREIEAKGMKATEIEPSETKAREIEPAGLEVEEIEAEAKETVPTTVTQSQIGRLSTTGDILETFPIVRDIKMNTLTMREEHRYQVRGVNLSLSLGITSELGGCNH